MLKVALYFARVTIASCAVVFLTPADAQQKIDTIKIIVGYPPGGASDRAARWWAMLDVKNSALLSWWRTRPAPGAGSLRRASAQRPPTKRR